MTAAKLQAYVHQAEDVEAPTSPCRRRHRGVRTPGRTVLLGRLCKRSAFKTLGSSARVRKPNVRTFGEVVIDG